MRTRRGAVVAAGIAVAAIAVGIVLMTLLARPPTKTEVGVVVFVDSVSLTDVRRFAIRTTDGRTVEFTIGVLENGAQFPPGHLGVHEVTAEPVRVTYRDEGGEHVAVRLEDAAPSSPTPS